MELSEGFGIEGVFVAQKPASHQKQLAQFACGLVAVGGVFDGNSQFRGDALEAGEF
jgi:hypothetical protein